MSKTRKNAKVEADGKSGHKHAAYRRERKSKWMKVAIGMMAFAAMSVAVFAPAPVQAGHPWCELPEPSRPFWCDEEGEPLPISSCRSDDPFCWPNRTFLPIVQ